MPVHRFHGLELPIRDVPGARAIRVVHPPNQRIGAHRHDWPLLTLPLLGGYREECEQGVVAIDGPAAIYHPAGVCHANCIHPGGMETFSIEFDPDWLGLRRGGPRFDRSEFRLGGKAALAGRSLIRLWCNPTSSEAHVRRATAAFIGVMFGTADEARPAWIPAARHQAPSKPTAAIAKNLGLHPAWLAREYRRATGEGLRETARRHQVEAAVVMLRESDEPIAAIAAATGFCDQSHLNRAFAKYLGRSPLQVRKERDQMIRTAA